MRDSVKLRTAAAILLVFASSLLVGAQGQAQTAVTSNTQASAPAEAFTKVNLTAGRSTVLPTDFDVTRIAVTNPEIADAVVVQPREILIDGKKAGTISLIVWGSAVRKQYDIVVEQPIAPLEQQLRSLFPGEDVTVSTSEGATVLSGRVSSTNVMLRMGEIASASIPKAQLVNLLQVPGGTESQQVMLQVRFAEVNRRVLTEAGLGLFLTRDRHSSSPRQISRDRMARTESSSVIS
jgi:pilus assembly protein CpaC